MAIEAVPSNEVRNPYVNLHKPTEHKTVKRNTLNLCSTIAIAMFLSFTACATAKQTTDQRPVDLGGTWQGELRVIPCPTGILSSDSGRCDAVNQITFNLLQTDASLAGTYHCAIGTMVCRDANTTDYGKVIDSSLSGRNVTLRVLLPGDLSTCLYNGLLSSSNNMGGSYRCYQGGGLAEIGQWQVSRGSNAAQIPPPWRPE